MNIISAILTEVEKPYNCPTDIIGFASKGRSIANALLPIINPKEICFFDKEIKTDPTFHYLDFADMLKKTEIMIFTIELPNQYYNQLNKINKKVKIFIPKDLTKTVSILKEKRLKNNLILL